MAQSRHYSDWRRRISECRQRQEEACANQREVIFSSYAAVVRLNGGRFDERRWHKRKTAMKQVLLVLTMGLLWITFAHARAEEQRDGKEMLQQLCARCHSIGRTGRSPNRQAPPFRSFSETKLYDSDFLQRLQDGYSSIHPFMPTFRFNWEDANEVLNYMKSIQEPYKPK